MKTDQVRKKFLGFFKKKEHAVVESDSLVPKDDPTVLFTTAGMQQFKRQFLGHIDSYTRAATSQKCLRTDDLDEVGQTPYHHTFFEMLGNFSFGDYFKEEAIEWAWEFLTKELGIPEKKLWVSVYKDDQEAYDIWAKKIKIPKEKIFKLGDKSNFWPANAKENGPNGPCGPCSEIFYDFGPEDAPADPEHERFSEVWNLVFTQYNRRDDGSLAPLPSKNIDTGMGLERLAAVLQGCKNNFDTDAFQPIIKALEKDVLGKKIDISLTEKRVIADHIRAIVFGIADGVIPSNKERGYVIKGLINNATNIILSHGGSEPSIYKLVATVIKIMEGAYPELAEKTNSITNLIQKNEESFIKVRNQRVPEIRKKIKKTRGPEKVYEERPIAEELGKLFFTYRDTYGLPLNTILEIADEEVNEKSLINLAMEYYQNLMKEQQARSRSGSKMATDVFTDTELKLDVPKTKFVGYESLSGNSKILKIFKDNKEVKEADGGSDVKIVLDQTPFYAEAGGQVGDKGTLSGKNGSIQIIDTQKIDDIYIHQGTVTGTIKAGDKVQAQVDDQKRSAIMRNHTATHLLQAALRSVLGSHVQQQGSLVTDEKLRFDFTHPQAIKKDELQKIEDFVNSSVMSCDLVEKKEMSIDEARKSGALAFFAEKYGDRVRVVSINGYSKEFCGGTHLNYTGQIGSFKIVNESAIAQGIRRIEAATGYNVPNYFSNRIQKLEHETKEKSKKIKDLERELDKFRFETLKENVDSIIKNAAKVNDISVILHVYKGVEIGTLRKLSDMFKQKLKSGVIVLGGKSEDNAHLIATVTDDLVKKNIKANELITQMAELIDGSGGGRPQMAQAGSKSVGKLESAVKKVPEILKGLMK